MRSSISRLVIGTAVAIALSIVGVGAIGSAAELESIERAQVAPKHYESFSDADARLGDRQQLRRMFINESSDRIR